MPDGSLRISILDYDGTQNITGWLNPVYLSSAHKPNFVLNPYRSMLNRLHISNAALVQEFFEDAHVLGIQCTEEPYRFVWMVNNHFGYDFKYVREGEVAMERKNRRFFFPIFSFNEPVLDVLHLIYTGKYDGEFLLPEVKHTDFLWVVKGSQAAPLVPLLEAELRKLPAVQLVSLVPNHKIKNKEQLVL